MQYIPELALYSAQGIGTSHQIKFVRNLSEAEAAKHRSFFDLIVSVRNLLETRKIVEHAIEDWDNFYKDQHASLGSFSQTYANYRMATLLAMLIMLQGHVKTLVTPMIRDKKISKAGLEPWFRQDCRDGEFLKLAKDMRSSALHVKLPIHSYRVTKSIAEPTLISLKLHSDSNSDVQAHEFEDFRVRLEIFLNDTCNQKLNSKLKEILNPAFGFYGALFPGVSAHRSLKNLCILEIDSAAEESGAADSRSYSFLGDYLLDLALGCGSNL